jgi:hypothetical protein
MKLSHRYAIAAEDMPANAGGLGDGCWDVAPLVVVR